MGKSTKPEMNYVTYVGAHPHVSTVDFGIDFMRGEPVGPLGEELIKALTRDGDSKDFVRSAAPAAPVKSFSAPEPAGEVNS